MSQNTHQDDGKAPSGEEKASSSSSDPRRRKRPSFRSVAQEVMSFCKINKYVEVMEPLIRRVVKEEVELALEKHMAMMNRDCRNEMDYSESRSLQLQFLSALSLPVFTGTRIEGGDCNTLKVALIDAHTGKTVTSGVVSSAKVEIVVLEGDFVGDEGYNWTLEEFNANIVRARQGKKPLLNGNALLNLTEGIGLVGDISFTDNSSWTRSRKFRLGARVLDNYDGVRVREAKSESFVVRDHRGELYKKHHPPYLSDEIWRLEKIGKDGAFHKRLNREKVKTVKDFLVLFFLDPTRLRNILGSGMSARMWEVTVEHARRCVVDDNKLYLYCPRSQKRDGVVFNVVGQVLGILSNCKYVVADKLSETEKAEAHKLVISAFQHLEDIVAYDDEASLRNGTCSFSEDLYPSSMEMIMGNPECNRMPTSYKKGRFDYPQRNTSSPDVTPAIHPVGVMNSLDEYGMNSMEDLSFDQPSDFQCQVSKTLICDPDPLKGHNEGFRYFDPCLPADLQSPVDGFLFPHSAVDKRAQRRWKIVSSVMKWLSLMLKIRDREIKCQSFSYFQGEVSKTMICDPDPSKGCNDDFRYSDPCLPADLQSAVNGFLFRHSAVAQRRWKIVFSVLKWLSLMLEIRERSIIRCSRLG